MILAVDIGNTHIKIGAWDDSTLVFLSRLQTSHSRTQDEYAINILDILHLNGCNRAQFDGAIIGSVVPGVSVTMRNAVITVIQSNRVFLVSPSLETGLNIKTDDPAILGSDLVCAGVAALNKYPMPCYILSLGTATTVFAMDQEGNFMGGCVCAGVTISLDALSMRTAQLPRVSLDEPVSVIGANTVDSIISGAVYGTAGMLDSLVDRMQALLGEGTVVACGGSAGQIVPHCTHDVIMDDQLVLEGLRLIYHKNVKLP